MMMPYRLFALAALSGAALALSPAALSQETDEPGSRAEWEEGVEEPQNAEPLVQQQRRAAPGELSSRPGSVVVLRGLDKVTARTRDFEINVGDTYRFGALDITVRYCRRRPPEEPPEVFAFLEIDDQRTEGFGSGAQADRLFSGWMFASNPALNALDHPVYDVWVIDCRA